MALNSLPGLAPPKGFGTLAGQSIRPTQYDPVEAMDPERIWSYFENRPQPQPLPDYVVATQGPVTKDNVARLLATVNGEESGWSGVTPDMALKRLQDLGLPTQAKDWSLQQWEQAIAVQSATPNVLSLLGYD